MIDLPLIIAIFFVLLFGVIAVFFSFKEGRIRKRLKQIEKSRGNSLAENGILKQIADAIGYSLDNEKIIEIITANLESMLTYSSVSAMVVKKEGLKFDINLKDPVDRSYVEKVKENMLKSLGVLLNTPALNLNGENIKGAELNEKASASPLSFFNVPVLINGKAGGLICIASTRHNFFSEEEMMWVYKITELVCRVAGGLEKIIVKEDGKLASMMSSLDSNVFMVDADKKLTLINQAARDFLKIQNVNPTLTDVLSSLPSSYNFVDKIDKAISLNQKIEEKNISFQGKSIDILIIPIIENSAEQISNVAGVTVFVYDATPEKSLAKMKEDFTNIIVHELRSPLTSIKASSEMLNGENTLTEDEKKRLIAIIYEQTCKMLNEVSMILDAAKLDSGLFTVHKTSGDLKKAIGDSVEVFRNQAQNKFINLVTNIDPFMPQVSFDNSEIRRVISNLLTNSLKFTQGGGTITVRAWTTPEKIFVTVSDTGTGIPVEKQHLLFAKFAQIQTPNATVGTGLGLYIAKGIIDAHSGSISFQTEPGKGTTITFWIPNTSAGQTLPNTPPSAEKSFSPLAN